MKKVIFIVIGITVIGGASIFGFWFIKNSNLATYQNQKYGFEIKYPKSWFAYELTAGVPGGERPSSWGFAEISTYPFGTEVPSGDYSRIIFIYLENQSKDQVFESMSKKPFYSDDFGTSEIKIAGINFYKIINWMKFQDQDNKKYADTKYIFSDTSDKGTFLFDSETVCEEIKSCENYLKDIDKMISTFKLINKRP
jgi:hypothetical protein